VKKSLLAKFVWMDDPKRAEQLDFGNPFWETKFDFVLAPAPNRP
jgi:catechol 1,2-dioxygenase